VLPWTAEDIPSQKDKVAVITGATGGLGYETALALAGAGAEVVLTGRNADKGKAALANIRTAYPGAALSYETLDLASLASVKAFAERCAQHHRALDLLINNGGVMAPPTRYTTIDGFELQFATNYLSHYSLTAQLLPLLRKVSRPRVVNLSSILHRFGAAIRLDDLQWEKGYKARAAYGQSKLAMLMFALELQRHSDINGWGLMSNAAHPGYATTALQSTGPRMGRDGRAGLVEKLGDLVAPFTAHSAADGALPTLYAATSLDAKGGAYYGPTGFMELKGPVGEATVADTARDREASARLWSASEALTHVTWPD
jgi:NAD(P)-dependent dehydrogenase (short-subunit alcohol dehydrogenase family)